jgi:hypothetical protein
MESKIVTLTNLAYVLERFVHVAAMALLLGGTVFYVWVVPWAIAELKEESKLIVFARARITFRWIVFSAALVLLISGAIMTAHSMWIYRGEQIPLLRQMARISNPAAPHTASLDHPSLLEKPTLWFSLHVGAAVISLLIATALVRGGRPPHSPLSWMRLNFVLLMLAVLFAVLARESRQRLGESIRPPLGRLPSQLRE